MESRKFNSHNTDCGGYNVEITLDEDVFIFTSDEAVSVNISTNSPSRVVLALDNDLVFIPAVNGETLVMSPLTLYALW